MRAFPIVFLIAKQWVIIGINRRTINEPWRNLDQSFIDQHCHRVEIAGMRFQAQSLRFQRDRAATSKGVEHRRRIAVGGLIDLVSYFLEEVGILYIFPVNHSFDQPEKTITLSI